MEHRQPRLEGSHARRDGQPRQKQAVSRLDHPDAQRREEYARGAPEDHRDDTGRGLHHRTDLTADPRGRLLHRPRGQDDPERINSYI